MTLNSTNFALYSRSMGLYVRAETNCGPERPLYAASATIGPLETFSLSAGTPPPLSTLHIEAENYTAMSGIQTQAATGEGAGQTNIAFINNGDWVEYAINLPVAGDYAADFRVAAFGTAGTVAGSVDMAIGAQSVGSVNVVAAGGGWQDWTNVTGTATFPAAGPQTLRLNFTGDTGFLFNVNWMKLIVAIPTPTNLVAAVQGDRLVLTWPNGQGWRLESQTNALADGLGTNWVNVPGAVSPHTNAINRDAPSVFYRLRYP